MEADPQLNPALHANEIAAAFARDRRVHIPAILMDASATRVQRCLEQETEFSVVTRNGDGYVRLRPGAVLTQQQEAELVQKIHAGARDGFHYLFDNHPMSNDGEPYPEASHYLAAITRFLNSAPFLDFVRQVTGRATIAFTEAQATRYRAGHFLNQHDDSHGKHGRIAAYVLNMTPHWRWDWGGALMFSDRPGHVCEGFLPAFNALNIFAVPQEHLVSYVTPFAGAPRHSISGWFRSR